MTRAATGGRAAAWALAIGAIAAALAATPFPNFDLDRHAVPKELALHLTALAAGGLALVAARGRPLAAARLDRFLAGYVAWCALSALFAVNHWLALRALAISASGLVCYWAARRAAAGGHGGTVRAGVGLAIALAAASGLVQTYVGTLPVFAESRAPGGTFGNRNFLAHVAALGLPLFLVLALEARRAAGLLLGVGGGLLAAAMVFLSRSRAAWLGAAAGLVLLAAWALVGARPTFDAVRRRRLALYVAALGLGIGLAAALPNRLRWNARNPYGETVSNLVDASEGSGRGRLIQYRNTLKLVGQDPVFGIGPGNWAVRYPTVTTPGDPAYVVGATVPTNPWPSSDWVSLLAERGPLGLLLLAAAFVGLAVRAWQAARARSDAALAAWGAAGVAGALVTVGTFDAVLLNGAPTLFAMALFGAMVPVDDAAVTRRPVPRWAPALLGLVVLGGVVRSGMNLAGLAANDGAWTVAQVARAARLDPGNYRLQWEAGRALLARGPRAEGCVFARRAARQFPFTEAAQRLARRCRAND